MRSFTAATCVIVSLRLEQFLAVSDTGVDLLQSYRLSHNLAIPDSLIAATAIVGNYPFITKNQRHYRFIQGLNLLPYP